MSGHPERRDDAPPWSIRFAPGGSTARSGASSHAVELWLARTDLPRELESVLSPAELARAERFRFSADRQRFVIGRGMVRTLLAERLDIPAASVPIVIDRYGRPRVCSPDGSDLIHFSVSHAGDCVVAGLCASHAIGVDVELCREDPALQEMVAETFAAAEQEALAGYSDADWIGAVYSTWTRKEAVVKAIGVGLSMQFTSFEVSVGLTVQPRVIGFSDPRLGAEEWTLYDLELPAGVAGALAVRGTGVEVVAWEFG